MDDDTVINHITGRRVLKPGDSHALNSASGIPSSVPGFPSVPPSVGDSPPQLSPTALLSRPPPSDVPQLQQPPPQQPLSLPPVAADVVPESAASAAVPADAAREVVIPPLDGVVIAVNEHRRRGQQFMNERADGLTADSRRNLPQNADDADDDSVDDDGSSGYSGFGEKVAPTPRFMHYQNYEYQSQEELDAANQAYFGENGFIEKQSTDISRFIRQIKNPIEGAKIFLSQGGGYGLEGAKLEPFGAFFISKASGDIYDSPNPVNLPAGEYTMLGKHDERPLGDVVVDDDGEARAFNGASWATSITASVQGAGEGIAAGGQQLYASLLEKIGADDETVQSAYDSALETAESGANRRNEMSAFHLPPPIIDKNTGEYNIWDVRTFVHLGAQAVPSLALSIIAGKLGGAAAGSATRKLGKLGNGRINRLAKTAGAEVRAREVGGVAGALSANAALSAGQTASETYAISIGKGVDERTARDRADNAAFLGALWGFATGRLSFPGGKGRRLTPGPVREALQEAIEETGQTIIVAGQSAEVLGEYDLAESAIAGAIGGFVSGVALSPVQTVRAGVKSVNFAAKLWNLSTPKKEREARELAKDAARGDEAVEKGINDLQDKVKKHGFGWFGLGLGKAGEIMRATAGRWNWSAAKAEHIERRAGEVAGQSGIGAGPEAKAAVKNDAKAELKWLIDNATAAEQSEKTVMAHFIHSFSDNKKPLPPFLPPMPPGMDRLNFVAMLAKKAEREHKAVFAAVGNSFAAAGDKQVKEAEESGTVTLPANVAETVGIEAVPEEEAGSVSPALFPQGNAAAAPEVPDVESAEDVPDIETADVPEVPKKPPPPPDVPHETAPATAGDAPVPDVEPAGDVDDLSPDLKEEERAAKDAAAYLAEKEKEFDRKDEEKKAKIKASIKDSREYRQELQTHPAKTDDDFLAKLENIATLKEKTHAGKAKDDGSALLNIEKSGIAETAFLSDIAMKLLKENPNAVYRDITTYVNRLKKKWQGDLSVFDYIGDARRINLTLGHEGYTAGGGGKGSRFKIKSQNKIVPPDIEKIEKAQREYDNAPAAPPPSKPAAGDDISVIKDIYESSGDKKPEKGEDVLVNLADKLEHYSNFLRPKNHSESGIAAVLYKTGVSVDELFAAAEKLKTESFQRLATRYTKAGISRALDDIKAKGVVINDGMLKNIINAYQDATAIDGGNVDVIPDKAAETPTDDEINEAKAVSILMTAHAKGELGGTPPDGTPAVVDDFPTVADGAALVKGKEFKTLLTARADKTTLRLAIRGVYVHPEFPIAIATDGHRMHMLHVNAADDMRDKIFSPDKDFPDGIIDEKYPRVIEILPLDKRNIYKISADDAKVLEGQIVKSLTDERKAKTRKKAGKKAPNKGVFIGEDKFTMNIDYLIDALDFMDGGGFSISIGRERDKGNIVDAIVFDGENGRLALVMPIRDDGDVKKDYVLLENASPDVGYVYYRGYEEKHLEERIEGYKKSIKKETAEAAEDKKNGEKINYANTIRRINEQKNTLASLLERQKERKDKPAESTARGNRAVEKDEKTVAPETPKNEGIPVIGNPITADNQDDNAEEKAPVKSPRTPAAALREQRRLESELSSRVSSLFSPSAGKSNKKGSQKTTGGARVERASIMEKLRNLSAETGEALSPLVSILDRAGGSVSGLKKNKPMAIATALVNGIDNVKPPKVSWTPVADAVAELNLSAAAIGSEYLGGVFPISGDFARDRFDSSDFDDDGFLLDDVVQEALKSEASGGIPRWNVAERRAVSEHAAFSDLLSDVDSQVRAAGFEPENIVLENNDKQVDEFVAAVAEIVSDEAADEKKSSGVDALAAFNKPQDGEVEVDEDVESDEDDEAVILVNGIPITGEVSSLESLDLAAGEVSSLESLDKAAANIVRFLGESDANIASKAQLQSIADESNMPADYEGSVYKWVNEQMEMAVNFIILRDKIGLGAAAATGNYRQTMDVFNRFAKTMQTGKRDGDVDKFQQFSTPPPMADIAASLAGLRDGETALEPSAGNGALAAFLKNNGGENTSVFVNEIDPARLANLKSLQDAFGGDGSFAGITDLNAHTELRGRWENGFDVVLMNPPFSHSAGRKNSSAVTDEHVAAALSNVRDGGRAVIVTGENWLPTAPTHAAAFKRLYKKGWVPRASVWFAGPLYLQSGAGFPTRITVLDKFAADDVPPNAAADVVSAKVNSWDDDAWVELQAALAKVAPRSDVGRPAGGNTPGGSTPGGLPPSLVEIAKASGNKVQIVNVPVPPFETLAEQEAKPLGERRTVDVAVDVKPQDLQNDEGIPPIPLRDGAIVNQPTGQEVFVPYDTDIAGPDHLERMQTTRNLSFISAPPLRQGARLANGAPILRESDYAPGFKASRLQQREMGAAADAFKTTYHKGAGGDLNDEVLRREIAETRAKIKELDSEDKNGIAKLEEDIARSERELAGQTYRGGYMSAMGTGVGKTIIAAGLIKSGRELGWGGGRSIVFSLKDGLLGEGSLDKSGRPQEGLRKAVYQVGGMSNDTVIRGINAVKSAADVPFVKNLSMFFMYSELAQKTDSTQSAVVNANGTGINNVVLQYLKDKLPADFDGLIVFDEAHSMGNATPQKGERGDTPPSSSGIAGLALQNMFPNSRILYLSASPFKESFALAYAPRLGMVGSGVEPFQSDNDLREFVAKQGNIAMEIIPQHLKATGKFNMAELSSDGLSFSQPEVALDLDQQEARAAASRVWYGIYQAVYADLERKAVDGGSESKSVRNFGLIRGQIKAKMTQSQKRFFDLMDAGFMAPWIGEEISKVLANGDMAVVQTASTYDAAMKRSIIKAEAAQGKSRTAADFAWELVDLTPVSILEQALEIAFDVSAKEVFEEMTASGKVISKMRDLVRRDADGEPITIPNDGVNKLPSGVTELSAKNAAGVLTKLMTPLGSKEFLRAIKGGGFEVVTTDPESAKVRDGLLKTAHEELAGTTPDSPIDIILSRIAEDHGTGLAAEISGRSARRDFSEDDWMDNPRMKNVPTHKPISDKAKRDWLNGDIRALVFSQEVGGVGYDFHASRDNPKIRKADGSYRRVHHFILSLDEKATSTVQGFGRTHRTNQTMPPALVLPVLNNIVAKLKLAPVIASIGRMGALSTGSKKGMNRGIGDDIDVNDSFFKAAVAQLAVGLEQNAVPGVNMTPRELFVDKMGMTAEVESKQNGIIDGGGNLNWAALHVEPQRFNNYMAVIGLEDAASTKKFQEAIYEYLFAARRRMIEDAPESSFDTVQVLRADKIEIESVIGLSPPNFPVNSAAVLTAKVSAQRKIYKRPENSIPVLHKNNKKYYFMEENVLRQGADGKMHRVHAFYTPFRVNTLEKFSSHNYKILKSPKDIAAAEKDWDEISERDGYKIANRYFVKGLGILNMWKDLPYRGGFYNVTPTKDGDAPFVGVEVNTKEEAEDSEAKMAAFIKKFATDDSVKMAAKDTAKKTPAQLAEAVRGGGTLMLKDQIYAAFVMLDGKRRLQIFGPRAKNIRHAAKTLGFNELKKDGEWAFITNKPDEGLQKLTELSTARLKKTSGERFAIAPSPIKTTLRALSKIVPTQNYSKKQIEVEYLNKAKNSEGVNARASAAVIERALETLGKNKFTGKELLEIVESEIPVYEFAGAKPSAFGNYTGKMGGDVNDYVFNVSKDGVKIYPKMHGRNAYVRVEKSKDSKIAITANMQSAVSQKIWSVNDAEWSEATKKGGFGDLIEATAYQLAAEGVEWFGVANADEVTDAQSSAEDDGDKKNNDWLQKGIDHPVAKMYEGVIRSEAKRKAKQMGIPNPMRTGEHGAPEHKELGSVGDVGVVAWLELRKLNTARPQERFAIAPPKKALDKDGNYDPAKDPRLENTKAKDENGNPKMLYHGSPTGKDILESGDFDPDKLGSRTNANSAFLGFFATDSKKVAGTYASPFYDVANGTPLRDSDYQQAEDLRVDLSMLEDEGLNGIEDGGDYWETFYTQTDGWGGVYKVTAIYDTEEEAKEALPIEVAEEIEKTKAKIEKLETKFSQEYDKANEKSAILDVYFVMNNPKEVTGYTIENAHNGKGLTDLIDEAQMAGHDGLIVYESQDARISAADIDEEDGDSLADWTSTHYVVFSPKQIINAKTGETMAAAKARFALAGVNAAGADKSALAKAQKMTGLPDNPSEADIVAAMSDKETVDKVWNDTGWILYKDGKWRFEVKDGRLLKKTESALAKKLESPREDEYLETTLDKVILLPKSLEGGIFSPDEIEVVFFITRVSEYNEASFNAYWSYTERRKQIRVNAKIPRRGGQAVPPDSEFYIKRMQSYLSHEIQHVIQTREGFSRGSSIEEHLDWVEIETNYTRGSEEYDEEYRKAYEAAWDKYRSTSGEAEAREVQNRLGRPAEWRAANPPSWDGEDPKDLIVRGIQTADGYLPQMRIADDSEIPPQGDKTMPAAVHVLPDKSITVSGLALRQRAGDPLFGALRGVTRRHQREQLKTQQTAPSPSPLVDLFSGVGAAALERASAVSSTVQRQMLNWKLPGGANKVKKRASWRKMIDELAEVDAGGVEYRMSRQGRRRLIKAVTGFTKKISGGHESDLAVEYPEVIGENRAILGSYNPTTKIVKLSLAAYHDTGDIAATAAHEMAHAITAETAIHDGGGAALWKALPAARQKAIRRLLPKWNADPEIGEAARASADLWAENETDAGQTPSAEEKAAILEEELFAYALGRYVRINFNAAAARANTKERFAGDNLLKKIWAAVKQFGRDVRELGIIEAWQATALFNFVLSGDAAKHAARRPDGDKTTLH